MSLLSVFTFTIGPSIAKAMLKAWLKDNGIISDIVPDLLDLLKTTAQSEHDQRQSARRIETLGVQIVKQMQPIFDEAGQSLAENGRAAVVQELVATLAGARIQPRLLVDCNLDPALLSRQLAAARPEATKLFSGAESAIYRRLLDEASRGITELATELNGFTTAFAAATLQDQDRILTMLADLWRRPEEADQQFEDKYRPIVQSQLDRLELFGLPKMDVTARAQRLTRVYITLQFQQHKLLNHDPIVRSEGLQRSLFDQSEDLFPEPDSPTSRARIQRLVPQKGDIDQILAFSRRLVIRGDAGSGKSTLLQWLAVRSSSRSFTGALSSWNNTIPFFIRLRERVESNFPLPEEFPQLIAKTIAGTMPQGWVHRQLEAGRVLVLIDGVDELPQAKREGMLQALAELVTAYPLARYIVTSRPSALKQDDWPAWSQWTNDEGFTEATLQPMTPEQVNSLIQQWHDAFAEKMIDPEERAEIFQLPATLLRTLRLRPALRRLTPNPLLCSMICALHRDSRENLPSERLKLYEQCVEMLLTKRDEGRKVPLGSEYARLTPGQQLALVQNFAYWMMRNGYSDVSVEEADDQFEDKLPDVGAGPENNGEKVRRYFVGRTNLIREPVDDRVDFTHRTFEEFLAAQQAVKENDFGLLLSKATDDQWSELIILAAGVARPKEAAKFLRKLVERGQKLKRPRLRHQVLLLAIACLETCIELAPDVRAYVIEQAQSIFPPKDDEEARLVAAAGDPAVPLLKYNLQFSRAEAVACVRALAQIGTTRAMNAIAEYMAHPDNEVIEAVVDAWDLFDRAEYARHVLSKGRTLAVGILPSWEGFEHLRHLKALFIGELAPGMDLDPLQQCKSLTIFSLGYMVPNKVFRVSVLGRARMSRQRRLVQAKNAEANDPIAFINLTPIVGLPALKHLYLSNPAISDLSPLTGLTQLTQLSISGLAISDLSPLTGLTQLTQLNVNSLPFSEPVLAADLTIPSHMSVSGPSITDLSPLTALTQLTQLTVSGLAISDLSPLAVLTQLTQLSVIRTAASDLSPLTALAQLTQLTVSGPTIKDLSPLTALTQLTQLSVNGSEINDLSPLAALTQLTQLSVNGSEINDLSPLAALTKLTQLTVTRTAASDLSPLAALTKLTQLTVTRTAASDLSPLAALTQLTRLDVSDTAVSDLSPLAALTQLTRLDVSDTAVSDLSPLAALTQLTQLDASRTAVNDLSPLVALTQLIQLDVANTAVNDLSPLATLTRLTRLDLSGAPVNDLLPLTSLTGLTLLIVSRISKSNLSQLSSLQSKMPSLQIIEQG